MARLQVQTHCQRTHMLYQIVDYSHVENSSQATFRRKRFNHDFVHDLRGKKELGSAANALLFKAAYIIDN
jgi:hypothetical protein